MSDIAIRAEDLSKQYYIGKKLEKYGTLRDKLTEAFLSPIRRTGKVLRGQAAGAADLDATIWALKDVSFEIRQGEIVGVIGQNGAGKSTLLKMLSRITEPTTGFADIHGRVGSLLEVGTGFHGELTGRENVYLNGAILGMKRAEIDRKFDEIVEFSEIEKFIDTPVKHYSSGMKMRLAFSVAAHLEPEILLIDEVLAVGDASFQKKCLGKMGDVAREGRTVLFVSHNSVALQSLCQRAIWLHDGRLKEDGEASNIISNYLKFNSIRQTEQVWDDVETAPGNEMVRLHRVLVRPEEASPTDQITMETPIEIQVELWNLMPDTKLHVTLHLYTEQHIVAFGTGSASDPVWQDRSLPVGRVRCTCYIPGNLLNSGMHWISVLIVKDRSAVVYRQDNALSFEVLDLTERQGAWYGKRAGVVRPKLKWSTEQIADDFRSKYTPQMETLS